ncbi:uncharacterized protein LOC110029575 [Phalaenopsis equestris]|uniref:uncharacterized protein LOC110029575 n=1 Tax=Phalaenopsis equestris TaxID=78828 RepID=UPI0009E54395|nr:uncharacterized protein LOC110029575 [Phalaenopsis equestris]
MEEGAVIAEKNLDIPALPDGEAKRIFIGGVGAGVTASDLEHTFSPLGMVHDVVFVRDNGRNFAFMDFEPSSDKSLSKLFSTYNGCTWKGGKLKLEIAKEHYFARLKREWAQDAKLASAPPPTKESLEFVNSHSSSQENSQIRIFFPNLRKVKPLPFKGTGKHKYSFQRIEVPPLPIHFCDCEEHSKALETTSHGYLSRLSTVVHEKERNIMTNVIDKLMRGDKVEISSNKNTQVATDLKISSPCNVDFYLSDAEVSDADDDNLVMNIGVGAEDDILMQLKGGMTQLAGEEFGSGNPQSLEGRLVQNKADSAKRKKFDVTNASSIKPNKKTRPISADGLPKPDPMIAVDQKFTSILAEPVPSTPLISSDGHASALMISTEAPNSEKQSKPNLSYALPAEGLSWLQKSSWKDLVRGKGSSSFSISNVLSNLPSVSPEMPKDSELDTITLQKLESFGEKSNKEVPQIAHITPTIQVETQHVESQNTSNMSYAQPSYGQSWLQKSSWKDLVGGRSSSSFDISNVLSGSTSASTETLEANAASGTIPTKISKTCAEKSKQKTPQIAQISPEIIPKPPICAEDLKNNKKESSSSVQDKHSEGQTSGVQERRNERPEINFGEVCVFMRNESEQQWSKAKAALSGYLKKNRNEGNASKLSKCKPPSRH